MASSDFSFPYGVIASPSRQGLRTRPFASAASAGNRHKRRQFKNGEIHSRLKALTASASAAGMWR